MFNQGKSSQLKGIVILVLLLLIWAVLYFLPLGNNKAFDQGGDNTASDVTDTTDTGDESEVVDDLTTQATQLVAGMTTAQKVAQMFVITPEALTGVTKATAAGEATKTALVNYPVGGIVYGSGNIVSPDQITTMIANTQAYSNEVAGLQLFTCVEEQGGSQSVIATNGNFTVFSSGDMNTITDYNSAYEVGSEIGKYLEEYGFNVDLAPVADVSGLEEVPSGMFSSNPEIVSDLASGVVAGLQANNILATMQHFPGIGSATVADANSAGVISKTLEQLQATDLLPFATGIEDNVALIMVGNVSLPEIVNNDTPASLAKEIVTDLLQTTMGYQGLVISDALDDDAITANYSSAQAAIMAIQAGNDLLLSPENFIEAYQGVLDAIESGDLAIDQVDAAVTKIIKAKLQLGS